MGRRVKDNEMGKDTLNYSSMVALCRTALKLVITKLGAENVTCSIVSVGSFNHRVIWASNTSTSSLGISTVVASLLGVVPDTAILIS